MGDRVTDEQLIAILEAVPAGVVVTLVGLREQLWSGTYEGVAGGSGSRRVLLDRPGGVREWFPLDNIKGIEIWR